MITDIDVYFFSVPVDFRLAYSRKRFSRWCLFRIEDEHGNQGLGCGTLYRKLPLEAHLFWRAFMEPWLWENSPRPVEEIRRDLHATFVAEAPGLVFGADTALWDLEAKAASQSVADRIGGLKRQAVAITEQLFINELEDPARIEAALARGTRAFKAKAGANPEREAQSIRRLREIAGDDVEIRVDANRGLALDTAVDFARRLEPVGVRVFEEPLRDIGSLADFRRRTGCAVILDESIRDPARLEAVAFADGQGADAVNVKLARVGGLTGGLELARRCKELGLAVAVGCAEDLGTGMAANVVLSGCLEEILETEGYGSLRVDLHALDKGLGEILNPMPVPAGPGFGMSQDPEGFASFRTELRRRGGTFGSGQKLSPVFWARESWNRLFQKWNSLRHRMGQGGGR